MTLGKNRLRRECLSRRASLTAADLAATSTALLTALRPHAPGRVAAYASVGTEPGTGDLLAWLLERGTEVLLPVLLPDGDLDWAAYDGALEPGPRGLLQPPGARLGRDAVTDCGLVVVPALAVDRSGTRLGRGGGSYDRALHRTRGWVVAALHAGELHARLPAEPHDRPVDAAVLPDRGLARLRPHPLDGVGAVPGEIDP